MLKIIRSSFLRRNLKVNAFSGSSANLKIEINGKSEKIDFSALWLRFIFSLSFRLMFSDLTVIALNAVKQAPARKL